MGKKRKMPGLNTSSTADISFMLLIFFLVTTSMDTDAGQTAGSIDDNHAVALALRHLYGIPGDGYWVLDVRFAVNGHTDLLSQSLQLVDSGRAERVTGCEEDLHSLLALDEIGKFGREGGLTGTVETGNENYAGLSLDIDVCEFASHELREFVVNDLHHHLLRFDSGKDILAHGLYLDPVAELLRHLVADVSVKQRTAYILQSLSDIDVSNLAFALQDLEGSLKSFR